MSSIQVNNPPDPPCEPPSGDSDIEEPDPESATAETPAFNPHHVEVEVLWDDCVIAERDRLGLSDQTVADAVVAASRQRGYSAGQIGVRITDDPTIHEINRRHLAHDYPTDVISFPYGDDPIVEPGQAEPDAIEPGQAARIEGELVASLDTAAENAGQAGWDAASELLLYIIHGVLHIGGMDDHDPGDRAAMRQAERSVLMRLGMETGPAAEGMAGE